MYEYVDFALPLCFVRWVREYSAIVLCSLPSHCTQYVNLIVSFTVSRKLTSILLDIPKRVRLPYLHSLTLLKKISNHHAGK